MERTWDVIRRYGTQSVMKVGLNQPIRCEVLEKLMSSVESDVRPSQLQRKRPMISRSRENNPSGEPRKG